MENFDVSKDYYALLGIPVNADDQMIISSYLTAQAGKSGKELEEVNKAFAVLINHDSREAYTRARAIHLAGLSDVREVRDENEVEDNTSLINVAQPVNQAAPRRRRADRVRVVEVEEAPRQTTEKGNKTVKRVGIAALVVLLMAGAGVLGYYLKDKLDVNKSNNDVNLNRTIVTNTVAPTELPDEDIDLIVAQASPTPTAAVTPAPVNTEAPITLVGDSATVTEEPIDMFIPEQVQDMFNPEQNVPEVVATPELEAVPAPDGVEGEAEMSQVKSFGCAIDPAQVEERAVRLLEYVNSVGGYNINTGLKWTLEDMRKLVLYVNGAYVPTNDANAFKMEDDFLAFACVPLNDPRIIRGVAFSTDCETDGEYIADPVNFTDMLLMGDSYCYPYLLWLQEEWNIITTSDNAEIRRLEVGKVMQSYADIMYGQGYKMITKDGREIVITANDLAARSRINDGNIFRLYGLMIPVFGSNVTEQVFTVDTINGKTNVSADDIYSQLNMRCSEDIIAEINYDEYGRAFFPEAVRNTYGWIQVNSITAATDNLYFGNTSYYEETQTYSLGK